VLHYRIKIIAPNNKAVGKCKTVAMFSAFYVDHGGAENNIQYSKSAFSFLRTLTKWNCPHLPAARRCC